MKAEKAAERRPFIRRLSTLLCWCVASRPAPPVNGAASSSVLHDRSTANIVENEVRVGEQLSEVDLATTSFNVEEALASAGSSSSAVQIHPTKATKLINTDHDDPIDESTVELDDELCGSGHIADDDTTHTVQDIPKSTNQLNETHSKTNGLVPSIRAEEVSSLVSYTAGDSAYWQLPANYPTISLVDEVLDDTQNSLGIMEEFWTSLHSRQSLVSPSFVHLYTAVVGPSALEDTMLLT